MLIRVIRGSLFTDLGVGIWDLGGERPDRAFLRSGFHHRGHQEGTEDTEFFWIWENS